MSTEEMEDEVYYTLSPGFILHEIVKDWGLTEAWNPKIYDAAYNDMMESLAKAGYIGKADE